MVETFIFTFIYQFKSSAAKITLYAHFRLFWRYTASFPSVLTSNNPPKEDFLLNYSVNLIKGCQLKTSDIPFWMISYTGELPRTNSIPFNLLLMPWHIIWSVSFMKQECQTTLTRCPIRALNLIVWFVNLPSTKWICIDLSLDS